MSHFDISPEIFSLLHQEHEVKVPKMGIFRTGALSAELNKTKGTLRPTYKTVTEFEANNLLEHAQIAEYIAYKRKISFKEANEIVQNFVRINQNALDHQQSIKLNDIGILSINSQNKIVFQSDHQNLSVEQYGLPVLENVFPITVDKKKAAVVKAKPMEQQTPAKIPPKSYLDVIADSALLKGLGLAIILILLFSTYSIKLYKERQNNPIATTNTINDNGTNDSQAGLTSTDGLSANEIEAARALASEDEDMDPDESTSTSTTQIEEVKEAIKPTQPTKEERVEKPTNSTTNTDEFTLLDDATYVVVGSYGSVSNARRSKAKVEAKGYVGKIEKRSGGKFRVMIELEMSAAAAQKQLSGIREKFKGAWIAK